MKVNEWLWFNIKNEWVNEIEQKPIDYYSDIYNPWQTKERLRVWIEVEWTIWETSTSKYCFATLSTNESTTSATSKTLTLNTFDTNDTWMSATSWRITITEDWIYNVNWAITFASNTSWWRTIFIRKNWTTNTELTFQTNQSWWFYTTCVFNRYFNLVVWDYIEIRAYQNSWWNLDVLSSSQLTYVQVVK